jgi:chemotaxis protein histidine kinase CheA
MSNIDPEIVKDFVDESKVLIQDLLNLLESIEGDFSQVEQLEEYGQKVDRIMGGAKSLAQMVPADHALHTIADYTALCKAVGYKASRIKNNPQFFDICVGLLLDATETLKDWMSKLQAGSTIDLKSLLSTTFLERHRGFRRR